MKALCAITQNVLDNLNRNDDSGNQFIVILGIPNAVQTQLDENRNSLDGIPFRFMFDGSTGLIKIIPSYAHAAATHKFVDTITYTGAALGVPLNDIGWAGNTTFRTTVDNKGKQPDNCLLPSTRQGRGGQPPGWPTMVLESGVSESLSKLHEDARWWFENSNGQVRIVIVMSVRRTSRTILLEKWQLASLQYPYIAQQVTITPNTVVGNVPLCLPFQVLFDRLPEGNETDFLLDNQALMNLTLYL
ncbi:hypothetical protein ASPZODRAFT_16191 [Penicilliopsis zonata CBS 506.65]|uniref:Uncharacterized protein n=1 Tax=Penicilliopsis zonata CBS 506.65 TaxID=1073090 RepID=A0A1L9SGM8_9EURO|nr:hypothetical protein ASPZODRAFT_16191 [Penicilliopsis zonata CBS 506.65]OJJ46425.1 hypothetical protein ASPZODRAFT_16191 [Penicilliopsis zonata CBS 506.65]